jgi:hypothetical protein
MAKSLSQEMIDQRLMETISVSGGAVARKLAVRREDYIQLCIIVKTQRA